MIKLRALTQYLLDRKLVAPEQLDSWTDTLSLDLVWKDTEQGLHMGDMIYTATIALERFADEPVRLVALIGSWLDTHDDDREDLPAPAFQITMLDNDLADVDLTLQFVEPQHLAEDPAGEIVAQGKTWSLIPYDLWVAEQGEVTSHG
ncbi:hypothetical protein PS3A_40080 [Pseudomonas sp. 3A(2025)]